MIKSTNTEQEKPENLRNFPIQNKLVLARNWK